MQNPFTTTFSKIPENTYIQTDQVFEIIDNFSYDSPSESVYKITGVRGSGKTVLLAMVERGLSQNDPENKWLICRLNPNRDMLQQFASFLYKEGFADKETKGRSFNVSASFAGTGGGIGVSSSERDEFYDAGTEIAFMLQNVRKQSCKILIGLDEVSKNQHMIEFASEYGNWLREPYPVYLVCTGLYENIERVSNVKNLTFFRRATTIRTAPLNFVRMVEMYKRQLDVDSETAKTMANMTKGYAYAFQKLGTLMYNSDAKVIDDRITEEFKSELFAYSYEKIWEEMSEEDKAIMRLIADGKEYKRIDVIRQMAKPGNYSVYRDRLLQRGLITARQGSIASALPLFGEYIKEYVPE